MFFKKKICLGSASFLFLMILFSLFFARTVSAVTFNPNFPTCTITFSGTTTITATASSTDGNITSLAKDGTIVVTPNPPTTPVTYSWTPTADSSFTATVSNTGNTSTCIATYTYTLPSCTSTDTVTYGTICTRKTGVAANSCSATSGTTRDTYSGASCTTAYSSYYDCQMSCAASATCVSNVCIPLCNTGSTNSTGNAACSSSWSPTTDYTCALSQSRTCYHNTLTGGSSCVRTPYTDTRTIDTTCTTHTGYTCVSGVCTPPAPTASFGPACSTNTTYTTTISWTANNVTWVDLSDKTTDAERNINYSHKCMNAADCPNTGTSTQAITGFGTHIGTGVTSLTAGTTYYARVWDNVRKQNSAWASFSVNICCNTCGTSDADKCTTGTECTGGLPATCTTTSYTGGATCTKVSNTPCVPTPVNCPTTGQKCVAGSCVYSAWIQTRGDVHSNTKIKAPGGP